MNKEQRDNLKKEINSALNFLMGIIAIFFLGVIFALAGFAILIIFWKRPIGATLCIWGILFYVFSVIVFGVWKNIFSNFELRKKEVKR